MLIVYASKTGNIERFMKKLPFKHTYKISDQISQINEPYILVTYTTGIGEIPAEVARFCQQNSEHLQAVVASGNRNWGAAYGVAADQISNLYGVPVMMKFELAGRPNDVENFIKGVEELEISRIK